jgi:hypothetical protein
MSLSGVCIQCGDALKESAILEVTTTDPPHRPQHVSNRYSPLGSLGLESAGLPPVKYSKGKWWDALTPDPNKF